MKSNSVIQGKIPYAALESRASVMDKAYSNMMDHILTKAFEIIREHPDMTKGGDPLFANPFDSEGEGDAEFEKDPNEEFVNKEDPTKDDDDDEEDESPFGDDGGFGSGDED